MSRVENLIGISERELIGTTDRHKFIGDEECGEDELCFINPYGETVPIGDFGIFSIDEMWALIDEVETPQKRVNCGFKIIKHVDIGELQAKLQTKDKAMIQVASNFNCLEVPGTSDWPDRGDFVEDMHYDSTQGPAACFGPLAATLYRTHFVFKEEKDGLTQYSGQTRYRQINLLEDVEEYFGTPVNGKICLDGREAFIGDIDKVAYKVKIGLHTDIRVLYGRERGKSYKLPQPHQAIDQVFSSTINITKQTDYNTSKDRVVSIIRTCLRAAYEGAYLSAIARSRKTLYLTLIGGGIFKNPIALILDEIAAAHRKYSTHHKSRLENVVLCLYDNSDLIEKEMLKRL